MQNKFLWFFKVGSCIFLKCWDWNLKKFPRKCWKKVKLEKYPSRGVFKKRCSENMLQIYRRTSMPKCYFNKVTEIILRHGCSPVNLQHNFRTRFPKNTSWERLLLKLQYILSDTFYLQYCRNYLQLHWIDFLLLLLARLLGSEKRLTFLLLNASCL